MNWSMYTCEFFSLVILVKLTERATHVVDDTLPTLPRRRAELQVSEEAEPCHDGRAEQAA